MILQKSLNIIRQPPTQFLDKPQPPPHFALPLPHLFLAKTFRLPHSYHFWKSWTPTHKGRVRTMSALLLKTLLPVGHQDVCLQKYHFWFWLIAAMFVYICTKCSVLTGWFGGPSKLTKWIKNKAVHWFGWFRWPTEGWKETAPWNRKFKFSLHSS